MLCPSCFHDIPQGSGKCPLCGAVPEVPAPKAEAGAPGEPSSAAGGCPWERRGRLGNFAAFGETLQKSLFAPSDFFRNLPVRRAVGAAILYAVFVGTLAGAVEMMWSQVTGFPDALLGSELNVPAVEGYLWFVGLIFLPLAIVVSTILRSLVLHLSLAVLGGAQAPLEATIKVVAYATSANAFKVFPLLGSVIAFFWRTALIVIGLRETHRISTGKAFMAWFLPFLVFSCIMGTALFGIVMALVKFWPAMGEFIEV